METPLDAQREVYGTKGPPMLYETPEEEVARVRQQRRRKRRKVSHANTKMSAEEVLRLMKQHKRSIDESNASTGALPGDFPPELSYRALAAYSLLRTLSVQLRLSPFTPTVFLRALYLPFPNKLMGQIHVSLLRILLPNLKMGYSYKASGGGIAVHKRRHVDNIRWTLRAGENLTFLDSLSWPLFFDDYCHLTADRLWASIHDNELNLDFRNVGIQPIGVKEYEDDDDQSEDEHYRQPILPMAALPLMTSMPIAVPGYAAPMMPPGPTGPKELYSDDSEYGADSEEEGTWGSRKEKRRRKKRKQRLNPANSPLAGPKIPSTTTTPTNPLPAKTTIPTKRPTLPMSRNKKLPTKKSPMQLNSGAKSPKKSPHKRPISKCVVSDPLRSASKVVGVDSTPTKESSQYFAGSKVMDVESPIVGMLETTTPTSLPVAPTLLRKPEQRGTPLVPTRGDRKVSKVFEVTEATPLHKSYLVKRTPEKQQSPMKLDFGSATKEDLFTKTCSGDSNIKADDKRTEEFSQKQPRNNTKKLPENLSFESTDNSFKKDSTTSAEESSQKDSPKTKEKVTPQKVPIRREAKSCQKGINGRRMLPIISKKPSPEKKNEAMDIQTRQLNVDSTRQGSSEPSRNSEHDSTKRNSPSSKRPRGRLVLPMHNASKNMHPNPPADIPVSHALKKQAVGITQQQRQLQMQQFHKYQMQQMQMQQFRMQQTAQAKGFMPGNINPQLMMQNKYSFQGVPQYGHAPHFVPSSMSRGEGHTRMLHHQQMIGLMPHTGGHPLKPGMTDHYAFQPSRNKPLEVSGAIASALQNFMCGIESKPTDSTDDTLGKSTGFEDDDDFDAVLDNERWRHFEPLKVIRAGVPYHKLPITQKMDILEFLIDELLSVDVIAAEFSKRKTISDCYEFPWGVLPAEAEFESLENDDECGVCLGEGELLCCDGCVSSYHRGCLDMSLGQVLPDGKWLCPECHLVDPAKYGPLRGGRKASLDWFSVDDISAAIRNNEPQILLGSQGNSNSMIAPASTDISENSAGALKVLSGELSTARKEISGGVVQASTVQLASNQTSAGEAISRCFKSSFEVPILDKGAQVSQINVIEPKSGDLKTVGVDPPALDKGASVDATKQLSVEVPDLNNRIDLQLSSAMGNSAEANKPPDITLQLKVEPVDPAKNATALKELPLNPEVENGEEPPREMSMPKGQETQKSDETIGSANSITPGLESALALQQAGDIEPDPLCKGLEFLVVHGHMFCRRIIDSFEGKNVEFERQQPYFVLTREEVEKYFKQVGGKISRSWPFAQIPASDASSSSSSWQFPSSRLYMSPMEAFDPSFYANRYRKAPVSFFMKAGGGAHIMKLMLSDYENECSQSSTYRVTEALTRDMSLDKYVADCLRTQLSLFDPYQMVTGYMVRLDAALKKSCLINELWETGSTRTRDEVWLCNVRKCKSVGRLSLLLLKLVDQIHPRAFKDDWFHNPLARGSSDVIFDSHYEDLPTNWSEKTEMRKRLWERTPSEMLLDLCKKEECHIEDFLQGVRSDVGKPIRAMRSKRKPGKPSVDKEKESFLVHGQQFENIPIPIQHDLDKVSQKPSSGHDNTGNAGKPSTVPGESNSFSDHVHLDVDKITGIEPSDEGNKSEFYCKAPEVPEDREDTIDTGKAESTDPSEGPEIVNAGNKRRTRRSGRFGRFAVEAGPLAKKVRLSASESSRGPNTLSDLELQIVKHKKSKVPELEKIAKGVCPREMLWPIAGRNPFATFGNLPPREMKRLARNAGSVRAPHLAYGTSHEVAQVCLAYTWRKRTEMCSSIEELILQIRVLESCLDRAVRPVCLYIRTYLHSSHP